MYAAVNSTRIYYEIIGKGRPLIMVHGNSEDHTIFDEAVKKLRDSFKIYLIDSRGHGKSNKVEEYHYEDMAEDMIAFMRMLNLNDVAYYGFSDGGIIGLLLAMKSDRISRLIISGANLSYEGLTKKCRFLIKALYFFTKDPRVKMMFYEPNIDPKDLEAIKAKTIVMAGEKDLVSYEETKRIADHIPGSRLRILEKEGHGSYIIHKEKIADILLEELADF